MKAKFYILLSIIFSQLMAHAQLPEYFTLPQGPVAWYPFNNNTNDESGNGRDLLNSNVTFGPDRFGNPNSAAFFNGTNAYLTNLSFPSNSSLSKRYTVSLWAKPYDAAAFGYLLQQGTRTQANYDDCAFRINQGGGFYNSFHDYTPQADNSVTCSTAVANTNWVHIQIEWEGAYHILLINGVQVMQSAAPNVNDAAGQFLLGAYGFTGQSPLGFFRGYIDDVVVYYYALTLCQAKEIYRSCILTQPTDQTATTGNTATFIADNNCYSESFLTYQWKVNNGTGYQNLSDAGQYSGTNTKTLSIANVSAANTNNKFTCIITGNCASKSTDTVTLTVTQPSGLQDMEDNNLVSISPNPASSNLALNVSAALLNQPYRILNALGQQVMEGTLTSQQTNVDLSSMSNGIYSVQIAGYRARQLVLNR